MFKNLYIGEQEFLDYQDDMDVKEYLVTELIRTEPPEKEYSMSSVPIGYYKRFSNRIFSLNFKTSKRILILGSTGSGKTVLQNTIIDRFVKSGGKATLFDLKGEYVHKNKPLPKEFANKVIKTQDGEIKPLYLFPSEKPQGFPIKSYYPIFLQRLRQGLNSKEKKLAENEILCQFGLINISKPDFFTFFMPLLELNKRYYEILDKLWDDINKYDLFEWDALIDFVKNAEKDEYDPNAKRGIIRIINHLKKNEIVGDNFDPPEVIRDINEDRIGILDLQGLLNLPASINPALVYVNVLLRRIYDAKVQGIINRKVHNLIAIDEVNKFAPRLGSNPSKDEFLKLLDLVRSEHISMLYSTQDYRRIPETLISQANYIFLAYNTTLNDLAEIIKMVLPQEYSNPFTFKRKLAFWQRMMQKNGKTGKRDWLVISRDDKFKEVITPVLPLSYFVQETDNY